MLKTINYKPHIKPENRVASSRRLTVNSDVVSFGIKQKFSKTNHKENKKKTINLPINRIAALLNLTGGLALITSFFLPKINIINPKIEDASMLDNEKPSIICQTNIEKTAIQEILEDPDKILVVSKTGPNNEDLQIKAVKNNDDLTKEEAKVLEDFEKSLKSLIPGEIDVKQLAKILLALSMVVSGMGQVKLGLKTNQPTEVASGTAFTAFSAVMAGGDINVAFGFLYMFVGFFFSGLANNLDNIKKPANESHNFDLTLLKDPDNWKKAMTDKQLAKTMRSELIKVMKFMGNDQKNVMKASSKALLQTWQKITGKRIELPDIVSIEPSGDQCRTAAAMMYLAGAMMLISTQLLGGLAFGLIATANTAENYRLVAMGKEEKDWGKPALISAGVIKQLSELLLIAFPESMLLRGSLMAGVSGTCELSQRIEEKDQKKIPIEQNPDDQLLN